ncbi:uncharacterized protein LOC107268440 [Cephus cinctus]|uniref:Uncharacterized protein LOC107268440 n=1 Tax=Cephus cinctus TaxID=211228 RepID=A0AAJ7RIH4_CEPCN|nr:uncharacterized protein LOC107268440 [Cephus cinctus]
MCDPCSKKPSDKESCNKKQDNTKLGKRKSTSERFSLKNIYYSLSFSSAMEYFKKMFPSRKKKSSDLPRKSTPNDVMNLISVIEDRIKEFYAVVTKKITNFLDNDIAKLKNHSKEEIAKTKIALSEYSTALQKISEEKLQHIAELKHKYQTKLMTLEEAKIFVKFFEEKMTEVKKLTEEMILKISKADSTPFAKELQIIVKDNGEKMKSAVDALLRNVKEGVSKVEDIMKTIPVQKTVISKLPKIIKIPRIAFPKMSDFKLFKKGNAPPDLSKATETSPKKPLIPIVLKNKFPHLNLTKHFNSETVYGRANVAKATYAGILIWYLYRKVKNARS